MESCGIVEGRIEGPRGNRNPIENLCFENPDLEVLIPLLSLRLKQTISHIEGRRGGRLGRELIILLQPPLLYSGCHGCQLSVCGLIVSQSRAQSLLPIHLFSPILSAFLGGSVPRYCEGWAKLPLALSKWTPCLATSECLL